MTKKSNLYRFVLILGLAVFFSGYAEAAKVKPAAASVPEKTAAKADISDEEMAPFNINAPEEVSLFDENTAIEIPSCNAPWLIKDVVGKVREYFKQNPAADLLSKRHQRLTLKYLENFNELDIKTLPRSENAELSDKLIMYRINKGLKESNFRICKSSEKSQKPIYLLIYPEENGKVVEILNFVKNLPKGQIFGLVYN